MILINKLYINKFLHKFLHKFFINFYMSEDSDDKKVKRCSSEPVSIPFLTKFKHMLIEKDFSLIRVRSDEVRKKERTELPHFIVDKESNDISTINEFVSDERKILTICVYLKDIESLNIKNNLDLLSPITNSVFFYIKNKFFNQYEKTIREYIKKICPSHKMNYYIHNKRKNLVKHISSHFDSADYILFLKSSDSINVDVDGFYKFLRHDEHAEINYFKIVTISSTYSTKKLKSHCFILRKGKHPKLKLTKYGVSKKYVKKNYKEHKVCDSLMVIRI
jgi:hypothetical protein